jgi:hypothetical protein
MRIGIGLSIVRPKAVGSSGGLPALPGGFAYLVDGSGNYLVDGTGVYLIGAV